MAELRLAGCASRPLGSYLKALGLLRIVTRGADPGATGRWHHGAFELRSALDRDELDRLLLEQYAPAPVVSPWNGGSGFHPKDDSRAIEAIEVSETERLEPYRRAIAAARESLRRCGIADKPEAEQKAPLVRQLRRTVPDEALDWIDAAVVIRDNRFAGPRLLGTGGNDGRFDFSNNYAQCVVASVLAPDEACSDNLAAALWGDPGKLKPKLSLAHFSRDSSPNNSPYGEADSLGNPWDLILAVEGSLPLSAGTVRRHNHNLGANAVAPFVVRPTGAGYGSAVAGESGHAELWLPLWGEWSGLGEIVTLAREFRAQVSDGQRLRDALSGMDLARACGELGVARGILAFERFALLERAGQATLAVPAGTVQVGARPGPVALQGLDRWLRDVERFGEDERCPSGPRIAIDRLRKAAFAMASRADTGAACATLEALGEVESVLARSGQAADAVKRPAPNMPAAPWIEAADDGSDEFAIAAAIASLRDVRDDRRGLPTVRDYLHGTRRGGGWTEFDPERRHAVNGRTPTETLAALQARRHLDAARAGAGAGQLGYPEGSWIPLDSVRLLAAGQLDEGRMVALLRGLALLSYAGKPPALRPSSRKAAPQPALELIALAWHSADSLDPRTKRSKAASDLGARPGWAARLASGAAQPVAEDAALRLLMAGLPPLLDTSDLLLCTAPTTNRVSQGQRLAAALLPLLRRPDLGRLVKSQILPKEENNKAKDMR
jgi:CRISPR-associated protein Csx17